MDIYDNEGNLIRVEERKMSLWEKIGGGSLLIATLFHVILLVAGALWVFQIIKEPEKKVDFMPAGGGGGERGAQHQVQQKKRAQITPSTNVKRVFAEGAQASYAIPEQGDNFGEMSALSSLSGGGMSGGLGGAGSGNGFGPGAGGAGGLGMGGGAGKLFGMIPETMRKRCSKEDRLQRLKENGGTPACDEAVIKSLRWLKSVQNSDGSWGTNHQGAYTGFVLLAYLGHCETPVSEEFGDSCLRGIVYLTNLGLKNDGRISTNFTSNGWCYEHAIATYALGEAYTFCKELKQDIPGLAEVTEKAGQFIIDNQNKNGGWAYLFGTEAGAHTDVSIVGWQMQALKACSYTNIKYRGLNAAVNKGLDYLATCQADHGGFGYAGKTTHVGTYFNLTGVGMLCYQMWGKGNRSEVKKASKYIVENTQFDYHTEHADLYCHYYESQAMMQMGGEEWKKYNDLFRDQLLNNQEPDGRWKSPGGGLLKQAPAMFAGQSLNVDIYRNTFCTLMLEVYYRFLKTGGGGAKDRFGI
jgi:prenyltransferase beta subunit